jgi:hypothetical protein
MVTATGKQLVDVTIEGRHSRIICKKVRKSTFFAYVMGDRFLGKAAGHGLGTQRESSSTDRPHSDGQRALIIFAFGFRAFNVVGLRFLRDPKDLSCLLRMLLLGKNPHLLIHRQPKHFRHQGLEPQPDFGRLLLATRNVPGVFHPILLNTSLRKRRLMRTRVPLRNSTS